MQRVVHYFKCVRLLQGWLARNRASTPYIIL
jgi:hypothetical protein